MSPTTTFVALRQLPFVRAAVEALATLPVRGMVTVGPSLDPGRVRPAGDVAIAGAIPHDQVLTHAAAMITTPDTAR